MRARGEEGMLCTVPKNAWNRLLSCQATAFLTALVAARQLLAMPAGRPHGEHHHSAAKEATEEASAPHTAQMT